MKILVACEESQRVCVEFRKKGHEAYSCDIIEQSGGHPEWHIMQDVLPLLNGDCEFTTRDGKKHIISGQWDMIIAFPPCTYLAVSGNRWFNIERYGQKAIERYNERNKAINFFKQIIDSKCNKIIVENPIGVMSSVYRKPDQIIQPYYFGDPERKSTCLWLKGVDKLTPTNIVEPAMYKFKNGKGACGLWHINTLSLEPKERAKVRSKTFPGIAKAMAEQWGCKEV